MAAETITASSYLKEAYTRLIMPDEDGGFYGEILEFPGCRAQGETPSETYQNLENAAQSWIEACLAMDQEIPRPFNNLGFSGRIALRLPRSLHRQAARMAERDGTSLNQFLMAAVAAKVGAEEFYASFARTLETRLRNSISIVVRSHFATTNIPLGQPTATPGGAYARIPAYQAAGAPGFIVVAGSK